MSAYVVAKYLRLSGEDADLQQKGKTESNSISHQRDLLTDYIRRGPGFETATIIEYCDDGWSGKNFERPAVRAMLASAKRGEIQCIMVKDLSRFGRDYLTVGHYLSRVFPSLGVRFIAVNDNYDSNRPTDIDSLSTSFQTLLYDLYSRDASRKVRSAKLLKAQRGAFLSPVAPFGYCKDPDQKNHLVIDPEAAQTVRLIFQLTNCGQTTTQIARTLNEGQIPTPMLRKRALAYSGRWSSAGPNDVNFWTRHMVTSILRDARYLGKTIYGKRKRKQIGDSHTVKVNRSDWITVENTHDSIVTPEEFTNAQVRLRAYAPCDGKQKGGSPLYPRVRCGVCGYCMERIKSKNPYYVCHTSRTAPAYGCPEDHTTERDILETIRVVLHGLAQLAVEAALLEKEAQGQRERRASALQTALSALRKTLSQQERYGRELYENYVFGALDQSAYFTAKAAFSAKREAIMMQMEALETESQRISAETMEALAFMEKLADTILLHVLQEVIVYPGQRLQIHWNLS